MKKISAFILFFLLFFFYVPQTFAYGNAFSIISIHNTGSSYDITYSHPFSPAFSGSCDIARLEIVDSIDLTFEQDAAGGGTVTSENPCGDLNSGFISLSSFYNYYTSLHNISPVNQDVDLQFLHYNPSGIPDNYISYISAPVHTDSNGNYNYPSNQPPAINPISNTTINEGDTYSASGSFTDSDSTSWTATVDYGDGAGAQTLTLSGTNFSLSHVYQDNGTYTVTVSVTDNQGATGTGTAQITVNNVAPTPGVITAPSSPVLVNTALTASANFTDPGVLDTHTASWNWGDGNTTTGTVTETNGSGSVSNNHTYTVTGVYTITLTVTDKDGGVGTSTFQYVSVYDSNSSFAGGRSFDNPSTASPSTTGKVTFGISAKYNNSNVLTGNAKMNFKAASLDFASTFLSSLATSNGKAYLKGTGTLNGTSGYTFLATGIDGSVAGGNDLIRFQIKDSSNNVVYDSQPGAGDTADPTTVDATGNIRVH